MRIIALAPVWAVAMHLWEARVLQIMERLPVELWSVAPSNIVLAVSQAESAASFPERAMAAWSLEQYTQGRAKWTAAQDKSKTDAEDDGLVRTASMSQEDIRTHALP